MNNLKKVHHSYFMRRFLIAFLILFVLSSVSLLIGINLMVKQQLADIQSDQQREVATEKNLIEHLLDEAVLDLQTMSKSQLFQVFFTGEKVDPVYRDYFNDLLEDLIVQKSNYYQLRHLNLAGKEVFRIDWQNGKPHICNQDELQDKSDRYYFKRSLQLKKGEIYVSPFDLNIEHGKVELPHRPMIRICIPVYGNQENMTGINVLNFDGTNLIRDLDNKRRLSIGQAYLINHDGYFLNAPDTSIEWGFMFADKKDVNLKSIFSKDYNQIRTTDEGQFRTDNGLYAVTTVFPFAKLGDKVLDSLQPQNYSWKMMSFIPQENLKLSSLIPLGELGFLYGFILVAGLIFAYLYSNIALRKYEAQQELIESEKKLKLSNLTKDRFFSIISHDLKNASGSISGYLKFMRENFEVFSDEEKMAHLDDVNFAASQHRKLLNEILDWARLQQGKVDFNPTQIDIKELFQEQKNLVELSLKNKGLNIEIEVDRDLKVFGDLEMLKTIFRNLVNNAIKFSFRDDRIILSGKNKAEKAELKVVDFGMGMKMADAEKIFDLSSKVQRMGTENETGTGFGLKLVAELVEKNQGTIKVESELGKGASFIVNLPSGQ